MSAGRLSDRELLDLVEGDEARLERHLFRHPEDADRIEVLTSLSPTVAEELAAAVAPPADINARILAALQPDPLTRETIGLLGDLLALPFHTARALGEPTPETDEGDSR